MTSSDDFETPRILSGLGGWLDDRFGGARGIRQLLRKVFPDHWSFMLGEIALYSFIILLLTGTFLSLFFVPSTNEVIYHGSYTKLDGIRMSEAYQSTLNISFDVRAGLLMRQIHHWAADLFMASLIIHMLRNFFTGAFRKPREVTWIIGVVIFMLGLLEGLFGYSLPDDQLSGAGIRILEGVLLGIPIVGTYATFFLFGGEYPGTFIVPRLYITHVLLVPGILLALITAHVIFVFYQKHTAMPAKNQTDRIETGQPFYPYFLAKTTAWFFFVFAACALLATFATINPIWLYGPYTPIAISSASQPDFYMGWLEGALRMMPAWEWNFLGHTITFSVFIPFIVPAGIIFGGLLFWPFFEQWATGDRSYHHVNDRPRNAPIRTATGIAGVVFYGVLWLEGANDVIADFLQIPLYTVTWIARVLIFVAPVVAFIVTRRICLGLQRQDRDLLEHGLETGIIRQLPHGEFIEVHRPMDEEERAILEAKKVPALMPARGSVDENGVPAPHSRGVMGRARAIANRAFGETIAVEADGHGNGHGPGEEFAEIGPGELTESSIPHPDPLLWHPREEPPEES
jgi:ubiquinol-cytochrome c reductase cytochrome b subunit